MTRTALARTAKQTLSKYDPHKGVKNIRVLEGVKKHYAKARDAENLKKAIRLKWDAQAEFVFWWDTEAKKDTGGDARTHAGRKKTTGVDQLQDYGLDKFVVHQWRKKSGDPRKFEAAVAEDFRHALARVECERRETRVSQNTGETEWFTPKEYADAARAVLGVIDLDPASTNEANAIIQAEQIYTAKDNGLAQQWDGRVWMNPPYAQPLVTQFCEKLAASVKAGTVPAAVVLVNNATETGWFRALGDVASAVCFPTGRVRFWHPKKDAATPLQGQAVLYIGDQVPAFLKAFQDFGLTWVRP